jgi:hypothetical protein
MDLNVAAVGADDGLPGSQKCAQSSFIGLGAAHQKMHIGMGGMAQIPDDLGSFLAVGIYAVADRQLQIGAAERIHNHGMGTVGIVIFEKEHENTSI